jgi:hypothetical protein
MFEIQVSPLLQTGEMEFFSPCELLKIPPSTERYLPVVYFCVNNVGGWGAKSNHLGYMR